MPRLVVVALAVPALIAGGYGARAQDGAPRQVSPVMQVPLEKSRAAIAECRERRLRKEFATYKESAQCSNPRIFAAWRDAGYPHMDLITDWLNTREEASEKVDQHTITPAQFEQQMDALTIRLTTEEQRRRTGLIISSDGDMRLQLPPATEVVGVATPPGEEKLAAKKTAAARQRAAFATASADPSAGASVASMARLAPLDADKSKAVGGPLVPLPPGEGSSGLYAHLTSQRSETEARTVYHYLQGKYASVLTGRDAVIRRVDDGNQGTYYRVEIGPLSSGQADQLCGTIKSSGGQCVPRYE